MHLDAGMIDWTINSWEYQLIFHSIFFTHCKIWNFAFNAQSSSWSTIHIYFLPGTQNNITLKTLEYWALFNSKGGNQNSVFDILQLCLPAKAWYEWLIKKRTNYCKLNSWSVEYSRFWLLFLDWVWHWPAMYPDFSWILSSDLLPTSKSHKQAPVHCPWQHTVKIWRENCPEQKYTHILCSPTHSWTTSNIFGHLPRVPMSVSVQ